MTSRAARMDAINMTCPFIHLVRLPGAFDSNVEKYLL
jgi:hypothetical protein